jgi:hypothetical protein
MGDSFWDLAMCAIVACVPGVLYGRRKGQKLAFKTKQTYNVISVTKKT